MFVIFSIPVMASENLIVFDDMEITEDADYSIIQIEKGTVLSVKNGASINVNSILNYGGTLIIESDSTVTIEQVLNNALDAKTIIESDAKVNALKMMHSLDSYLEVGGELKIGKEYYHMDPLFDGDISIKESGMMEIIIMDAQPRMKATKKFEKFCFQYTNQAITAYGIHNIENGICTRCGKSGCNVTNGDHTFKNRKCTSCGYICQDNFHNGVCPGCGMLANAATGSVFSNGSQSIVVGILAAVIFGTGGFFLGRRKVKPVTSNIKTHENSNEEDEE